MGNTKIEWVRNENGQGKTWNPLIGCTRVSPGCQNCYAESMAARFSRPGLPYEGVAHMTPSGPRWTGKIKLLPDTLNEPLRWKKPSMVFVNSMSDLFHPDVPEEFIWRVFGVMALATQHTFQVLTKRPERMAEMLGRTKYPSALGSVWGAATYVRTLSGAHPLTWPLSNVWLGTSVENQDYADKRIPDLIKCPAAVHFLSCEPLLGPLDLTQWLRVNQVRGPEIPWPVGTIHGMADPPKRFATQFEPCLDWAIAGGESGRDARPMHPDWIRSLRDQCQSAGVAFFFKQWGEWLPNAMDYDCDPGGINYNRPHEFVGDVGMAKVGKKASGRKIDGRVWDEMPGAEVRP